MIRVNQKAKLKWKLETADWEKYTNDVESKIPKEYSRMNFNKLERKLRKAMLDSAKKNIGKKKVTIKSKPWMTEEIKEAIKNRKELRKEIGHKREE